MDIYKPIFIEAFQNKDVQKAIKNMEKIISRRTGKKLDLIDREPMYFKKAQSGKHFGYSYFVGEDMIRFNWIQSNSSQISSIDIWYSPKMNPDLTIDTSDLNIVQIIDCAVGLIKQEGTITITESEALNKKLKLEEVAIDPERLPSRLKNKAFKKWVASGAITELPDEMTHDEVTEMYGDVFLPWIQENNAGRCADATFREALRHMGVTITTTRRARPAESEEDLLTSDQERLDELLRMAGLEPMTGEEIFNELEASMEDFIAGDSNGLVIAGDPGLGKSYTAEKMLQDAGFQRHRGYTLNKGAASSFAVYETLWNNRTGIIVFDDCDDPLQDSNGINLLKGALDSKKERFISWNSKTIKANEARLKAAMADSDIDYKDLFLQKQWDIIKEWTDELHTGPPTGFDFEGRVIVITNLYANQIGDSAFRTRVDFVEINLSKDKILRRIETMVEQGALSEISYSIEEQKGALEYLKSIEFAFEKMDFRTFHKVVKIYVKKRPAWQKAVIRAIFGGTTGRGRR